MRFHLTTGLTWSQIRLRSSLMKGFSAHSPEKAPRKTVGCNLRSGFGDEVVLEIKARSARHAAALSEIAMACARDVGQKVEVVTAAVVSMRESVLTLFLPAERAASQHEVWCLACRLACFCPNARVCVWVQGETAFSPLSSDRVA